MGDLRKKNIPQTDFDKKKNLAWPITLEKNLTPLNVGEKILSPEFWGKKILTQTKAHIHPIKSQKDDP